MDNILSNLQAILSNGLFGITLTIVGYLIGLWLNRKFKTPILNPLLIAMVLIIPILYFCRIPYDSYNEGGSIITVFLVPVTTILGYSILASHFNRLFGKLRRFYWQYHCIM